MGPSILSHEPEDFGTGRSVLTTISSLFVSSTATNTDESLFVSSTATNTDESLCVAVSAPRGRSLEIVQISAQFVPENDHEVHGVGIDQSARFRVTTRPTNKVGNHLSTREVQRFSQGIRPLQLTILRIPQGKVCNCNSVPVMCTSEEVHSFPKGLRQIVTCNG